MFVVPCFIIVMTSFVFLPLVFIQILLLLLLLLSLGAYHSLGLMWLFIQDDTMFVSSLLGPGFFNESMP